MLRYSLLAFVGGIAALVHELVWFQLLSLVIGTSSLSLAVLLATFMGGLCLGSLVCPLLLRRSASPARVYAVLELLIALCAVLLLLLLPGIYALYQMLGGAGLWVRCLLCALLLLPPTTLMGATLPVLATWLERRGEATSWIGYCYSANIAGGVLGCVLAGFVLLRLYDVTVATTVAVLLNLAVAAAAWWWARQDALATSAAVTEPETATTPAAAGQGILLFAIAMSGFTALGAEVVWTRLLALVVGGTVYTFALILACYLAALGAGSAFATRRVRAGIAPRRAFALCQWAALLGMAWAGWLLTQSLPYWPVDPGLPVSPWVQLQLDLLRCALVVMPAAFAWGASFPFGLAAYAGSMYATGTGVGRFYAANTAGAIAGALCVSLLGIGLLGTQLTQQGLLVGAAATALLLLLAQGAAVMPRMLASTERLLPASIALSTILAVFLIAPVPPVLVAYGRFSATWLEGEREYLHVGEGVHASLAVSEENGVRYYHNAGKVQASSDLQDMRLQRMLGHITTLFVEQPRSVFVLGLGAGTTAGAVALDPRVQTVTVAEIEALVPRVVADYFNDWNFGLLQSPKLDMHVDDGRHYLATTDRHFDAITSDPLDVWVKGAAGVQTEEFYELVKSRLNPGGIATVWIQLYQTDMAAVQSQLATFMRVFPHSAIFANSVRGEGYDLVLVGSVEPLQVDANALERRLARPEYLEVLGSLAEIDLDDIERLLGTFAGSAEDLAPWLEQAQLNRDRNLRLQYLAGLALNRFEEDRIFDELTSRRGSAAQIVKASPARLGRINLQSEMMQD